MDGYELRAFEVCGFWTIVLVRVYLDDSGHVLRECMYKGDHVPIDETDPTVRAVLLLHQIEKDLDWSLQGLQIVPPPA